MVKSRGLVSCALLALAASVACKGGKSNTRADSAIVAAADTSRVATEDVGAPDDGAEGSRYRQGDQLCCAKGEGAACCPGGVAFGTCAPYGGIYHDCIAAGQTYEGKVSCAHCCQGLMRTGLSEPTDASGPDIENGCGPGSAPDSLLVCIRCGDGICGAGENRCRCPQDCHP